MTIPVFVSCMSPSNQPVGSEMSDTARDEFFDDRDGWNREKHAGRAKKRGASEDPDHDHERMELDGAAENDGLVEGVLEQLSERHSHDHPDGEGLGGHQRYQWMNVLGEERIGESAEQGCGEAHVRNDVARTREDPDRNRPPERDADDGNRYEDGQAERATLEEDSPHVIAERLIDIVQHGERGLEQPVRDGSE